MTGSPNHDSSTVQARDRRYYSLRYADGVMPAVDPELQEDADYFDAILREARGLFRERNNVYRSRFRDNGIAGTFSLIAYKIQWLASRLQNSGGDPEHDEDLTEGFLDLTVYAALAALLSHYGEDMPACTHLFSEPVRDHRSTNDDARWHCVLCGATARVDLDGGGGTETTASSDDASPDDAR